MLHTDIDFIKQDYDILEITNMRNKDVFADCARKLFHDDYYVPDGPSLLQFDIDNPNDLGAEVPRKYYGGDMYDVTWNYLFLEYMRLAVKHPYGTHPDIHDIVKKINTEKTWVGPTLSLLDQVFEVMMKNRTALEQRRHNAIELKNRGFYHMLQIKDVAREKNYKVCYAEDLRVPNHSSVTVQVPNFAAAKITSDLLYFDGGEQTVSVKMVDTLTDPLQYYVRILDTQSRNCVFSLSGR